MNGIKEPKSIMAFKVSINRIILYLKTKEGVATDNILTNSTKITRKQTVWWNNRCKTVIKQKS